MFKWSYMLIGSVYNILPCWTPYIWRSCAGYLSFVLYIDQLCVWLSVGVCVHDDEMKHALGQRGKFQLAVFCLQHSSDLCSMRHWGHNATLSGCVCKGSLWIETRGQKKEQIQSFLSQVGIVWTEPLPAGEAGLGHYFTKRATEPEED